MDIISQNCSCADLKKLNNNQLEALCVDIRKGIIDAVNKNGGHLSSNLGVVETVVALGARFDFSVDKVVFDVGHQCYAYKMLTGRKEQMSSLRVNGGISGFADSCESVFDVFTSGHAGTSINACLGIATSRDLKGDDYFVIAVVGDGAFCNGLNLEGLFAFENKPKKFIILLNDNGMSISKNQNAFYKAICNDGNIVKNFGLEYLLIENGNDIESLMEGFDKAKLIANESPLLLHVKTVKGKGYKDAETYPDVYHGVGEKLIGDNGEMSNSLGKAVCDIISQDKHVVAITAGMKDGTGLACVQKEYPNNFYDLGIAESSAVTFAAGLASNGFKPIVAIYSTFMQRAYDQLLHDVCLQNLPVVFCLDRAGFVGRDGKTHQGLYDLSYCLHLPNLTVLAPNTQEELKDALNYALSLNSPVVIRYPKTASSKPTLSIKLSPWLKIKKGKKANILAVGPKMLSLANKVAEKIRGVGVISVRVVKPVDEETLKEIKKLPIFTLEENSVIGGFGSYLTTHLKGQGKVVSLGATDKFFEHGDIENQLKESNLTIESILKTIKGVL